MAQIPSTIPFRITSKSVLTSPGMRWSGCARVIGPSYCFYRRGERGHDLQGKNPCCVLIVPGNLPMEECEGVRSDAAWGIGMIGPCSGRAWVDGRILFVDDEIPVVEGYRRILHREFDVSAANSGAEGLEAIRYTGPYAVVISDMRMPGMNGSQFLAKARELAPDTIRMLLTGYSDMDAAIEAVNMGNIFRYLTKPCEKEVLMEAIRSAIAVYQATNANK